MKITKFLAFLVSFTLTLAALIYALPAQEEVDIPSYVRGSKQLSGSALQ